jgi:hypothetical protein
VTSALETVHHPMALYGRFEQSSAPRSAAPLVPSRPDKFIPMARAFAIGLFIFCGAVQSFLDSSLTNFLCSSIAIVTAAATILYTFRIKRFRRAPFSCLMIFGFNVSALSGALLIQSADLRPITYNLDLPLETFTALAEVQFLIICLHWLYLRSQICQALRAGFRRWVCYPVGLFRSPSDFQLWVFGLVGCAATILSARNYTSGVEFGNASTKFAVAYIPFAVAPFFIPMRTHLFGRAQEGRRSSWLVLAFYALLLISVAIVNNSRGTFSTGFLTLGLCFLIAVLSGNLKMSWRKIMGGVMVGSLSVPLFMSLSDLATAMVIARDQRSSVTPLELIEITLKNFTDKQQLAERRLRDALVEGSEYNENYVRNALFARFVYTKFVDVNMTNAVTLTDVQAQQIRDRSWNRIVALIPTPILNVLRIDLDKSDLGYSSGDLYSYIARGRELGSYTTGSEVPDGLTIFGNMFWPVLAFLVLVEFILYDGFTRIHQNGRLVVSAVGLLNIVPIFTLGVMQESVADQVSAIVRGVPQLILLYWILFIVSSIPAKVVSQFRSKWKRRLVRQ